MGGGGIPPAAGTADARPAVQLNLEISYPRVESVE